MPDSDDILSNSIHFPGSGNLVEAEAECQRVLKAKPDHAGALHLLGKILYHQGKLEAAKSYSQKAVEFEPSSPTYYSDLGQVYLGLGDINSALASFQRASELDPKQAEPYYGIGLVRQSQHLLDKAIKAYRTSLSIRADHLQARCNLGAALHQTGRLQEAIDCYREGLEIHPNATQLLYNLGSACLQADRLAEAEASFKRALSINPGYMEALFNLGLTFRAQGNLTAALDCLRRLIAQRPDIAAAHCALGTLYNAMGQTHAAIGCFNAALARDPNHHEAVHNLGVVYMALGEFARASACFAQVLDKGIKTLETHYNRGVCLIETGARLEAIEQFQHALTLRPGFPKALAQLSRAYQALCDWPNADAIEPQLRQVTVAALGQGDEAPVYPFDALTLPWTAELQYEIAVSHARSAASRADALQHTGWTHEPTDTSRIRIGYVSTKFCNHAGAHLIVGLFGKHERSRFEIFGYSLSPDDGSIYRKRIEAGCDHFVDLTSHSYTDCAQRIFDDRIQILIDLAVFNTACRPEIFALQPAPVQVSYLGFPGTSGADYMDYIITDRTVTPPGQQQWYTEKFVYLPHCYQINDDEVCIPETGPTRPQCGIPQDAFVFACFNNSYKIEPSMFDVWMRVLRRIPGSVLWLLHHSPENTLNLRREAKRRGISEERLVFADKLSKDVHLARHRNMNLFLDTRYYNAHTTASDALRSGVPLITMPGETFASRVAASLLHTVGLSELITTNLYEYEELAVSLAENPEKLNEIREKLTANIPRCPLFNTTVFARNLERAYQLMWKRFRSGSPPRHIEVPAAG